MIKLAIDLWVLLINKSNDCIQTSCDGGELYGTEKFLWTVAPTALYLHQQNWVLLFISVVKKALRILL